MFANRCFKNKSEAEEVLDEWIELGLGLYIDDNKNLFVPLPVEE